MEGSQSAATTNTEVSSLREIKMWHLYSLHRIKCHFICYMGRIFSLKSPWDISKYPSVACSVIHPILALVTEHELSVLKSVKNDSDLRKHLLTYSSGLATARATVSMTKQWALGRFLCMKQVPTQTWCREQLIQTGILVHWTWHGYRSKTEWKHRHYCQHSWLCKVHDVTLQIFAEQVKKIFWAWPCRALIGNYSQTWSWTLISLNNASAS